MKKIVPVLMLIFMTNNAAAQVYKCVKDGATVFSDIPCPTDTVGTVVDGTSGGNAIQPVPSSSQRVTEQLDAMVRERRLRELDFDIANREREIQDNINTMVDEIAELKKKSDRLDQTNAELKQSLANEMQAVTMKYRTMNTALQNQIKSLRAEKRSLSQ